MTEATDPVGLPQAWKSVIFSGLDRIAATGYGQRMLAKAVAVTQTSLGAGNHDDEGERTGENRLASALCQVVSPQIAIDAGANNGSWTLEIRRRCPAVRVIAVEPGSQASQNLAARVADDASVMVLRAALGRQPGDVTLYGTDRSGLQASLLPKLLHRTTYRDPHREMPHEVVPMVTPDQLLERAVSAGLLSGPPGATVVKIDTEGFERDIITALLASSWTPSLQAVQFEFHMHALAQGQTVGDFEDLFGPDFTLFRLAPRMLIPLGSLEVSEANYFGFSNWVAVRREHAASLQQAYRAADPRMRRPVEWRH
jgi:FkbM family methyltransferase